MKQTYISYKVVDDKFTYKLLNEDGNIIDEDIPLYVEDVINPSINNIIEEIKNTKKIVNDYIAKNHIDINKESAKELSTEKRSEVRKELEMIPENTSSLEAEEELKKICEKYNFPIDEAENMYEEIILARAEIEDEKIIAEKQETDKEKHPEKYIDLSIDETRKINQMLYSNQNNFENSDLKDQVLEIAQKHNVSYEDIMLRYKIDEKNRKKAESLKQKAENSVKERMTNFFNRPKEESLEQEYTEQEYVEEEYDDDEYNDNYVEQEIENITEEVTENTNTSKLNFKSKPSKIKKYILEKYANLKRKINDALTDEFEDVEDEEIFDMEFENEISNVNNEVSDDLDIDMEQSVNETPQPIDNEEISNLKELKKQVEQLTNNNLEADVNEEEMRMAL